MGQLIPIQPSRNRPTYHVKLYSLSADKGYETILLQGVRKVTVHL